MSADHQEFALRAHSHSWLLVADNLHEQAIALYSRREHGDLIVLGGAHKARSRISLSNRATFLLCGFALENVLKGFLVFEHPEWVSNGTLSKRLRTHSLTSLASASNLAPRRVRAGPVLREFERGLESWARYPCALTENESEPEQSLTPQVWQHYLVLAKAYGRDLMVLLHRGWEGPHGVNGYFTFTGSYLGATSRSTGSLGNRQRPGQKKA
jgi:hypothetical protein